MRTTNAFLAVLTLAPTAFAQGKRIVTGMYVGNERYRDDFGISTRTIAAPVAAFLGTLTGP